MGQEHGIAGTAEKETWSKSLIPKIVSLSYVTNI